ncbi:uncharacterized protein LOC112505960 [Cynara cardunculus var. scolymus]|uniref:uncharacterized protein LOC112505960 n=1 Tax=Cynara cardunculus var. scolymus TaxID=59895 RepID=UPI000D625241|nr:uncharacterized protein LOC112505960 [Cynara cardunculus var. scolymus]
MLPSVEQETDWFKWIPSKANIHLWRTLNNRLATRDNLIKRGVACSSDECPTCLVTVENLDHVFVNCSTAKAINAHMASWVNWWPVNATSVRDLWSVVYEIGDSGRREVGKVIMAAYFWTVWTQRNHKTFRGKCKSDKDVCSDIQFTAYEWIRCRAKFSKPSSWENWICNPVDAVYSACN